MARYTIRVELHNADRDDYDKLHRLLAGKRITDVITTDSGDYKMPPGEYTYYGTLTRDEVLTTVKSVAAQVVPSYAVLVTESAGRTWYGLKKVAKAA